MQSVLLNGFVFDLLLSEDSKIPDEINLFCLNNNGTAIMELSDFSNRLKDQKIIEFLELEYNKCFI